MCSENAKVLLKGKYINTGNHISNSISQSDFLSHSNSSRRQKKEIKMTNTLYLQLSREDKQNTNRNVAPFWLFALRTNNKLKNLALWGVI